MRSHVGAAHVCLCMLPFRAFGELHVYFSTLVDNNLLYGPVKETEVL